ncbi:MAG: cobalamin-binding protein [Melioribacteraceae bacterium]|nr:cobalamin-binding protein [Melioribacteraceae bacterium]
MRVLKIVFILILFIVFSCSEKKQKINQQDLIVDDFGNSFQFDEPPKRIITLAPNLTEFIYDLGLGNRLIGNTLFCDYPEEAKQVEKVGDLLTFNFEKILMLKPDLIFITVEGNTKETYDKFRELGLKVFVSNPRGFRGIKKTYLDFGRIFSIQNQAQLRIDEWNLTIAEIRATKEKFDNPTMYCAIELKPVMVAGKNTFINEIIEICGGKNLAENLPHNYPVLSREEILKNDPDYLLFTAHIDDKVENIIDTYPEWRSLSAVKNNRVLLIDRNLFGRPGPRFAEAVETLFKLLHPQM